MVFMFIFFFRGKKRSADIALLVYGKHGSGAQDLSRAMAHGVQLREVRAVSLRLYGHAQT